MNYDAIIEQLDTWARDLDAARDRIASPAANLEADLDSIAAGMRDVAADLARESDLPAEFRTWGPGDPQSRGESLNETIVRLRSGRNPQTRKEASNEGQV